MHFTYSVKVVTFRYEVVSTINIHTGADYFLLVSSVCPKCKNFVLTNSNYMYMYHLHGYQSCTISVWLFANLILVNEKCAIS